MSRLAPDAAMDPRAMVPRRRRGAELTLLVLALAAGVGAYAITELGYRDELPGNLVSYGAALVVLAVVAHLAIRFRAPYADPVLLPVVVLLNGLGLALIHRLDLPRLEAAAAGAENARRIFAPTQLLWTALGVAVLVAFCFLVRDHRLLQRFTYTSGMAGVILLALPLVPGLGVFFQGSRLWVEVAGVTFQPGEPAKIFLLVFFAGYLVVKRDVLALAGRRFLGLDLPRGRDLGPLLLAWAISLSILIVQQDLGSSLLFFGAFVILLYVSTERPGWLVLGSGLFAAGAVFAYSIFSHVQVRFDGWLDPFADTDRSFQIVQALYGLGYGNILGQGLGEGRPDLVPVAHSDFIAAALGEELGLTGLMAVIVLYGVLVERGLRTALICTDPVGKLLAAGVAILFGLQVFVGIGGVTKLIPLSGVTTPFLSYGGSSLVVSWLLVALLIRISDYARRPEPPLPPPTEDALTQVVRQVR